jgi:hypothetical protein
MIKSQISRKKYSYSVTSSENFILLSQSETMLKFPGNLRITRPKKLMRKYFRPLALNEQMPRIGYPGR